ncbi:MAG: SsrA-binding protein, partial [Candidatus Parcubacteria bacterium]|nr:SsrA-binding protein [Candidatus Parcubacteria bacterium]
DYKKAHFNYEILEKFEAGIELSGFEVKSLKKGQGSLEGSYVIIRGGEAYAVNMFVPPYQEKNTPPGYEPRRNRRLIMNREEIAKMANIEGGKGGGLTIVPISVYNKGTLIKISVAVVRGKKKHDKRETMKKRETERTVRREFGGR